MPDDPITISAAEAARRLGIGINLVRRLVRERKIPALPGTRIRVIAARLAEAAERMARGAE